MSELYLLFIPPILLIVLSIIVYFFTKPTQLQIKHNLIGTYGEVIYPVDRRDGAIVVWEGDEEVIIFCRSYGSKIAEGATVIITEYDFRERTFRIEPSPRKIYRH